MLRFAVRRSSFSLMQRRTDSETVAQSVTDVMAARDVSPSTLSQATGIPVSTLRERLDNQSDFTWGELLDVGGFFALSPSAFFEGVAA